MNCARPMATWLKNKYHTGLYLLWSIMPSRNYFNSKKKANKRGNQNPLTSIGYEDWFGKAPYISTENLL